jgi:hypothetical protein
MTDAVHGGVSEGISNGIKSAVADANPFKDGLAFLLNGTIPLVAKEAFDFDFAATANQVEPYLDSVYTILKELECDGHQKKHGCVDRFANANWETAQNTIQTILGVVVSKIGPIFDVLPGSFAYWNDF